VRTLDDPARARGRPVPTTTRSAGGSGPHPERREPWQTRASRAAGPGAGRKGGENMSGVRVVTDSACDLTVEVAAERGITVVPLTIRFGDEELLDRRDLSPDEFWRRCKGTATLPRPPRPHPAPSTPPSSRRATRVPTACCASPCPRVSRPPTRAPWPGRGDGRGLPDLGRRLPHAHHGPGPARPRRLRCGRRRRLAHRARRPGRGPDPRMRVYGALDTLEHLQKGGGWAARPPSSAPCSRSSRCWR